MYRIYSGKRYNVTIVWTRQSLIPTVELENVELLVIERAFVALVDKNGREHIYTGEIDICIKEL